MTGVQSELYYLMNKSLLSGFIGGLLAASLFFLPGWAIFLIIWFGVGYLSFHAADKYDPAMRQEGISFKIFVIALGIISLLIGLVCDEQKFVKAVWSCFTDSPPPKFRSPIYFKEENLTEE